VFVFNRATVNIFKLVQVKILTKMTNLRGMTTISAGIFTNYMDFNLTTLCLQHFLDREYKNRCSKMAGVGPADIGSLLFFQVGQKRNLSYKYRTSIAGFDNGTVSAQ
jgi:hypothetical protein